MPPGFRQLLGINQESTRIRAELARLVESRQVPGAEGCHQRIRDRPAAVHLDRQIEMLGLDRAQESRQLIQRGDNFRQTRIARELDEAIEIVRESLGKFPGPGKSNQYDFRAGKCGPERTPGGHGTQHVAKLQRAENCNLLWRPTSRLWRDAGLLPSGAHRIRSLWNALRVGNSLIETPRGPCPGKGQLVCGASVLIGAAISATEETQTMYRARRIPGAVAGVASRAAGAQAGCLKARDVIEPAKPPGAALAPAEEIVCGDPQCERAQSQRRTQLQVIPGL